MSSLQELADWAQVLSASTIVGGALFALFQVRELRRDRLDRAGVELAHTFLSPDVVRAFRSILLLPNPVDAKELNGTATGFEDEVYRVAITVENVGLLVYRRFIPIEYANQLMGAWIRLSWQRLKPFFEEERRRLGEPATAEWFQWLAERLDQLPHLRKEAAYLKYGDWRP